MVERFDDRWRGESWPCRRFRDERDHGDGRRHHDPGLQNGADLVQYQDDTVLIVYAWTLGREMCAAVMMRLGVTVDEEFEVTVVFIQSMDMLQRCQREHPETDDQHD